MRWWWGFINRKWLWRSLKDFSEWPWRRRPYIRHRGPNILLNVCFSNLRLKQPFYTGHDFALHHPRHLSMSGPFLVVILGAGSATGISRVEPGMLLKPTPYWYLARNVHGSVPEKPWIEVPSFFFKLPNNNKYI